MTTCTECGSNKETSQAEYWKAVNSIVDEIEAAVVSGDLDENDVSDRVHEAIDGSWWIIYTHAAIAVLTHSPNDGAYADNYGSEGVVVDGSLNWSGLAYAAMEADVNDRLDVPAWIEQRDEAAEAKEAAGDEA